MINNNCWSKRTHEGSGTGQISPAKAYFVAVAILAACFCSPAWADVFSFSTGNPDGKLGARSQQAGSENPTETETADDFILSDATVINRAVITGLIPLSAPLTSITNVEVELYHVFPIDSVDPPSGKVPTRVNSPADVEITAATRDGGDGTLAFVPTLVNATFPVANSVINKINPKPDQATLGEGPRTGEEVQIAITFTTPIFLPADHYFFRAEAALTSGDFLYLSAPRPTNPPLFAGDLQAWIRNTNLKPDWLRIGTDIVDGSNAPTFNMTFSLSGNTVPNAGIPGQANCHGKTVSALARQFGGMSDAAEALGFSSVAALQEGIGQFCGIS
jgi:hypothetical protein